MQFTTSVAIAALAAGAFAAPAPAVAKSMMVADAAEWTIESWTRTCNADNTSCDYSFGINDGVDPVTPCAYTIQGSPASETAANGIICGVYTVSSSYSAQFAVGFTTFAVTNQQSIIYLAYSESQITNGVPVSPDQSYAPQALP